MDSLLWDAATMLLLEAWWRAKIDDFPYHHCHSANFLVFSNSYKSKTIRYTSKVSIQWCDIYCVNRLGIVWYKFLKLGIVREDQIFKTSVTKSFILDLIAVSDFPRQSFDINCIFSIILMSGDCNDQSKQFKSFPFFQGVVNCCESWQGGFSF